MEPLHLHDAKRAPLSALALGVPPSAGVYRLYEGTRLLHIGMAAGGATLRSEVAGHARGEYGARTQAADRVEWEVAPDAIFAYRRFLALYGAATQAVAGAAANDDMGPSASRRLSAHA